MSNIKDRAVGDTRIELLLFHLDGRQLFGINVLKVKEILPCPHLAQLPQTKPVIRGVAELRGQTIPIVDLSMAIGRKTTNIDKQGKDPHKVIIAEFNRTTQGFLVSGVERIIVKEWTDVQPPPKGANNSYITGVLQQDDQLIQIIDVERVLGETNPQSLHQDQALPSDEDLTTSMAGRCVLVVDDSSVARAQTVRTLNEIGIPHVVAKDGREALNIINAQAEKHPHLADYFPLIISDIEMPEMDGYQLTRKIRDHSECSGIQILLHTSLDGIVNSDKAKQAGADSILTKFIPELLAQEIRKSIHTSLDQ